MDYHKKQREKLNLEITKGNEHQKRVIQRNAKLGDPYSQMVLSMEQSIDVMNKKNDQQHNLAGKVDKVDDQFIKDFTNQLNANLNATFNDQV